MKTSRIVACCALGLAVLSLAFYLLTSPPFPSLEWAVKAGHPRGVELRALRHPEEVHGTNADGQRILHVLLDHPTERQLEVADKLLQAGADPLARNGLGEEALLAALVTSGPTSPGSYSALELARRMARAVDRARVNAPLGNGDPPLVAAAERDLDVTRILVEECRANLESRDPQGNTALIRAVAARAEETAAYLLESGADARAVNQAGNGVWHAAAGAVPTAIPAGPGPAPGSVIVPPPGVSMHGPLPVPAAAGSQKPLVERLLEIGADARARNAAGETPLEWAVRSGDADLVRFLIQSGGAVPEEVPAPVREAAGTAIRELLGIPAEPAPKTP